MTEEVPSNTAVKEEGSNAEHEAKESNDTTAYDVAAVEAVAERLAFFFSDANIRQDFFVRRHLLDKKGEYPGHVPIDALLRFNTIKKHSSDPGMIVHIVKNVLNDKLKLSEDEKAITKVEQFTRAKMDGNISVSLYVSNIPVNVAEQRYTCSINDIRELFNEFGTVALVKLRFQRQKDEEDEEDEDIQPSKQSSEETNKNGNRGGKKRFPVGAALVEFESIESLEKAAAELLSSKGGVAIDSTRKLKIDENELEVILLRDFIDMKKKRKSDSVKDESLKDGSQDAKENDNTRHESDDKKFKFDWKQGCVIRLTGLPESCDREAILDAVSKGLDISAEKVMEDKIYADFSRGQDCGAIRFAEPTESVATLCSKLSSGDVEIADSKVKSAFILEGDEEKKYWDDFINFKTTQMRQRGNERNGRHNKKPRKY